MRTRTRPLIVVLVLTTGCVTVALCWLGWRLVQQQRAIDESLAREAREHHADALSGRIRAKLAETGERLGGALADSGVLPEFPDALVVLLTAGGDVLSRPEGLPFVPGAAAPVEGSGVFGALEAAEFDNRLAVAAQGYRTLAAHRDDRVKAGALLRLGGVLRKQGRWQAALEAYEALGELGAVPAEGLPADFAASIGRRAVFRAAADRDSARSIEQELRRGLETGRWGLARGTAEFYLEELGGTPAGDSWRLARALDDFWRSGDPAVRPRLERVVLNGNGAALLMSRAAGDRVALLAAPVERFLDLPEPGAIQWRLTDAEGRRLSGGAAEPVRAAARLIGTPDHPLTLHLWTDPAPAGGANGGFVQAVVAAMLIFLWGATYFIARSLRREAAVARLQSEFVAAVSHEFRSPVTTVRQMAEMLEADRVPGEERRRIYYQTLAREAARLQRLVEGLLDFGRIESGAERYTFDVVDVPTLLREVVAEFESCAREAARRIDLHGAPRLAARADRAAVKLALGNLIENAIKYSPGQSSIEVRWSAAGDRVLISVVDRGMGIPAAEREVIFRKFTRGREAILAGIRGTGIGLSMVRQVALAHGADVTVDSHLGQGSTFTLSLPGAHQQEPGAAVALETAPSSGTLDQMSRTPVARSSR